jgi:hypothetical protein
MNSRPEYKKKISKMFSELAKKRYESGDLSIGWKSRKKLEPSYPEKLTMNFCFLKFMKKTKILK